ncbi:sensor histidine kinase [Sphingobacterium detergens]|uniref:Histidine kinase n=1 Tax=Sphingobacterium detergens TaxID=1145106 RepID=A0A420ARW5_SPHD1|nr:histidine kinase [Sphingobacterium detergens]RKE47133.1 histidine kinase [Sphingobacterium detergens]
MRRKTTPLILFAGWIVYVLITIIVYGYKKNDWLGSAYEITVSHVISAGVFLLNALYIFPRFWDQNKYTKAVSLLLLVLASSILIRFLFAFIISPYIFNEPLRSAGMEKDKLLLNFFYQWLMFFLYSIGYWQATSKITMQRKLSESIAEESVRKELELENAALRAQINPHFTFNTLEHFRSQTMDSNPEVSYGIGCFMQILRAGITTPDEDGKVPLMIETNAIESTIFIFRQRFPKIKLEHQIEIKEADQIRILPHILVPIVENAFKHGSYNDEQKAIRIQLYADESLIKLHVSNKKGSRIKDSSTGIGLRYVRRHLESGYQDKHYLIINDEKETYSVDLTINLN